MLTAAKTIFVHQTVGNPELVVAVERALQSWAKFAVVSDAAQADLVLQLAPTADVNLSAGKGAKAVATLTSSGGLRLSGLIVAAIETGCRLGELLALKWADVNLDKQTLLVRAVERGAKKTADARSIPISTRLAAVLEMVKTDPAGREIPPSGTSSVHWEPACAASRKRGRPACFERMAMSQTWATNGKLCEGLARRAATTSICTSTISGTKRALDGWRPGCRSSCQGNARAREHQPDRHVPQRRPDGACTTRCSGSMRRVANPWQTSHR